MFLTVLCHDGARYSGNTVPSEPWDKPGTFRMTTGLHAVYGFPVRIVPLRDVKQVIGGDIPVVKPVVATDTIVKVPGSKPGVVYEVIHRANTGAYTCSCTGYQFRRSCRHIALAAGKH